MFIQAVDIQKYNYASIWQKNPLFLHKIQKYMKTVKSHITQLLYAMNEGIFEKEHPIALSLLSAISGQVNGSQAAKVGFYRCPCL